MVSVTLSFTRLCSLPQGRRGEALPGCGGGNAARRMWRRAVLFGAYLALLFLAARLQDLLGWSGRTVSFFVSLRDM